VKGPTWRIEDAELQPTPPGVVEGSWVSLHYLRSAFQRRWPVVAAAASAGMLLALATMFLVPASVTASSTVILSHSPTDDPLTAIQTDESVLGTRTVSESVVRQLGLPLTPDQFRDSFSSTQLSTELVEIELKAPTAHEAVTRLNTLASTFLDFRNEQLQSATDKTIQANDAQIHRLQEAIDQLTSQYNAAVAGNNGQLASEILSQKSQDIDQIATLQGQNQTSQGAVDALTSASHVIDPAAVVPVSQTKRLLLGVMSGIILGSGFGIGLIFLQTLLSNSLRRREDVATALGRPVRFSAGEVCGLVPWRERRRRRNLEVLATGLTTALPEAHGERMSVALVGVGDLRSTATVLVGAARRLQESGDGVFLVDLTREGWLTRVGRDSVHVYRPQEREGSAHGRLRMVSTAQIGPAPGDPLHEAWADADVVLVLGEVELGVGTGHLSAWADRVVLLVRAGKATAELLRSISRMLTGSGPDFEFAMLVGADRTDESLGVPRRAAFEEPQRRARG
jgi:capsular polysaccharide biosynthesis protein